MNEPHFPLDRLLADAAADFHPTPDPARLEAMLGSQHRRRGFVVLSSAAACLALLGGTVLAFRGDDSSAKLAPSQQQEQPDSTEPKTTDPKVTQPDDTEPKVTEPDETEPKVTEPPTTGEGDAPKTTEPKTTEPKTTEPKVTEPPTTEPKPTDPPTTEPEGDGVAWSAHQAYGVCEEDPPFDVFYGTAQPGSTITVTSDFGGGTTTAGEGGEWELRVYFPEAPIGQKIKVWVSSGEHLDDFWFKRLG
jgi:hypothetical protein